MRSDARFKKYSGRGGGEEIPTRRDAGEVFHIAPPRLNNVSHVDTRARATARGRRVDRPGGKGRYGGGDEWSRVRGEGAG